MTIAQLLDRIAHIDSLMGDNEIAHIYEDALRRDLLRYFEEFAPSPFDELARLALTTDEMDFKRHYA